MWSWLLIYPAPSLRTIRLFLAAGWGPGFNSGQKRFISPCYEIGEFPKLASNPYFNNSFPGVKTDWMWSWLLIYPAPRLRTIILFLVTGWGPGFNSGQKRFISPRYEIWEFPKLASNPYFNDPFPRVKMDWMWSWLLIYPAPSLRTIRLFLAAGWGPGFNSEQKRFIFPCYEIWEFPKLASNPTSTTPFLELRWTECEADYSCIQHRG